MAGATAGIWTPSAPAVTGRASWPGLGSSRTWWPRKQAAASASTSFSEPAWIPSFSAGRRSPPAFACSRSTGLVPQAWKRRRLIELGYGIPACLRLVPVDFEAGGSWWERLAAAGFDADQPAVVASAGVSMYLTRDANAATLHELASLAAGSTLVMTFQRPLELVEEQERPARQAAENGARASGTPFISFFAPQEILAMARDAGFADARHVSAAMLNQLFFAGRTDDLRTSSGEELLVATT
jgi:hypothetical protein